MAAVVMRKCQFCKESFVARTADVKRGWARFCSKSCKAKEQERRTGQNAQYLARQTERGEDEFEPIGYEYDSIKGWLG